MSGFNLPPGCSVNSIPGNSAEDARWEKMFDHLAGSGLSADEARARWESQPDLLAAMRILVASLNWEEKRSGTTYNGWEEARAALAKAEGRAK